MPNVTADRAGYIAALPTFAQTAEMIGIHPSGIGRAVKRLGIAPIQWGKRDKHLRVVDLMALAVDAQRETTKTVASRLLEQVAREHPEHLRAIRLDVDAFFTETTGAAPGPGVTPLASPESVLRAPAEPETARRLVALYTRQGGSDCS